MSIQELIHFFQVFKNFAIQVFKVFSNDHLELLGIYVFPFISNFNNLSLRSFSLVRCTQSLSVLFDVFKESTSCLIGMNCSLTLHCIKYCLGLCFVSFFVVLPIDSTFLSAICSVCILLSSLYLLTSQSYTHKVSPTCPLKHELNKDNNNGHAIADGGNSRGLNNTQRTTGS